MSKGKPLVFDPLVIEYVKNNCKGKTKNELIEMMKRDLGIEETALRLKCLMRKYQLRSGVNTKFKKGQIPFNKGTKGLMKPNRTSFKKGSTPRNTLAIGNEITTKDGYIYIKVDNKKEVKKCENWIPKQRYIYEQYHGVKVSNDHCVIFADGNSNNFDIDNLIMVTRKENLIMNKQHLRFNDAELTKTSATIAKLISATHAKKKG